MSRVAAGTNSCWRITVPADAPPYTAVCACGWRQAGAQSRRREKTLWHRHLTLVREMRRARVLSR